jgi:hypothetical protein
MKIYENMDDFGPINPEKSSNTDDHWMIPRRVRNEPGHVAVGGWAQSQR